MDDFVPSEVIKRVMRLWWLMVVLMIAGGVVGVLISRLNKPVYESQASITTSIDFAYAGRLSNDEEDYLISSVGDVIDSSHVLDEVKDQAVKDGIPLTDEQIREGFSKARQGYRWNLTVRDHDPKIAQKLTQIWVEAADRGLAELRQKSLDSLMLQSAQLSLQNCFSQTVVVDPASSYCSLEHIAEIRAALTEVSQQGSGESLPNTILLSRISTGISDNAYLPIQAVILKQNFTAIAGIFCGFLIALAILIFGKSPIS